MLKHTDFILSPIGNLLREVVAANAGIGSGIETYPLSEYILQSVFLKMTGFQEQKMKCICWDLATNDFEYRYDRFTLNKLGECSSYKEKKTVYKDLIDQITKRKNVNVIGELDKDDLRSSTISLVTNLFADTKLSTWDEINFLGFVNDTTKIPTSRFAASNNLLDDVLQKIYDMLYKHRNRCAHNTLSYQENLPTLKSLYNINYKDDNYFLRFSILILLDKIFIELYTKYLDVIDEY